MYVCIQHHDHDQAMNRHDNQEMTNKETAFILFYFVVFF